MRARERAVQQYLTAAPSPSAALAVGEEGNEQGTTIGGDGSSPPDGGAYRRSQLLLLLFLHRRALQRNKDRNATAVERYRSARAQLKGGGEEGGGEEGGGKKMGSEYPDLQI